MRRRVQAQEGSPRTAEPQDLGDDALTERASGLSMASELSDDEGEFETTTLDWTSDDSDPVVVSRLIAAMQRVSGTNEEVRWCGGAQRGGQQQQHQLAQRHMATLLPGLLASCIGQRAVRIA